MCFHSFGLVGIASYHAKKSSYYFLSLYNSPTVKQRCSLFVGEDLGEVFGLCSRGVRAMFEGIGGPILADIGTPAGRLLEVRKNVRKRRRKSMKT